MEKKASSFQMQIRMQGVEQSSRHNRAVVHFKGISPSAKNPDSSVKTTLDSVASPGPAHVSPPSAPHFKQDRYQVLHSSVDLNLYRPRLDHLLSCILINDLTTIIISSPSYHQRCRHPAARQPSARQVHEENPPATMKHSRPSCQLARRFRLHLSTRETFQQDKFDLEQTPWQDHLA
jgi:hypothetical protein